MIFMGISKCVSIGLTLVFLFTTGSTGAEERTLLRYKPSEDKPLIFQVTTKFNQKMSIGNMKADLQYRTEDISLWTLQKTDEKGNLAWQKENKRLQVNVKFLPVGEYEFDSKSDERDKSSVLGAALTPIFDNLNGAYLRITNTPEGRITKVGDYEELIGNLTKSNPVAPIITFGGTNQGAGLLFQEMMAVLSNKPVKSGDTWEAPYNFEIPQLGTFEGKKGFKYEGRDKVNGRETVRLGINYDISLEVDYKFLGVNATGTITTTKSSGAAHFDPEQGQLVSLKSNAEFSGNVRLQSGGNTFDVPIEITWEVTLKQLEKLPD
jgi:hypothetical protein